MIRTVPTSAAVNAAASHLGARIVRALGLFDRAFFTASEPHRRRHIEHARMTYSAFAFIATMSRSRARGSFMPS